MPGQTIGSLRVAELFHVSFQIQLVETILQTLGDQQLPQARAELLGHRCPPIGATVDDRYARDAVVPHSRYRPISGPSAKHEVARDLPKLATEGQRRLGFARRALSMSVISS